MLLFLWWIAGYIILVSGSTDPPLYPLDSQNVAKCLDYCHLKNLRFLLCVDADGQLSHNPYKDCNRGFCKAEDFELEYESDDSSETRTNRVEKTRVGQKANLRDLCLNERGIPIRRRCQIRNGKRVWQSLDHITCRSAPELSSSINLLAVKSPPDMISQLSNLLTQSQAKLAAADVFSISEIFDSLVKKRERNAEVVGDLMKICQKVMTTDNETLRISADVNATNSLLSNFEDYLDELGSQLFLRNTSVIQNSTEFKFHTYFDMGVVVLKTNELSVFFVDPEVKNITGMAIFSNGNSSDFKSLHTYDKVDDVRAIENLQTAVFLPEKLWKKLKKKGASYLVFKVYTRDALFVETAQEIQRRPTSNVISITIPGLYDNHLPEKLPFFLRNGKANQTQYEGGCGYWNYQTWLSDGISTNGSGSSHPVILCLADHLTQFTFLLGVSKMQTSFDSYEDDRSLDIITNVGLTLSLLGLFAIFLTAAVFKSFRSLASTKILLNLCAALFLQLLFFLILSQSKFLELLDQSDSEKCTLIGAMMQYLLLVVFSWMFIIGFLQYQRYVRVIGVNHPRHYILISAIVAWTLPLVPTLLVVFLEPDSYRPSNSSLDTPIICYPSGYGLSLGVILPIGLITVANAMLVGYITWSVYKALFTRDLVLKQLGLFVLLFFLLGITWIFGLCSYFDFGRIFAYLFCLTATLQGFVLFLFFIVFNKENQRAWLGLCCNLRQKRDQETIEMPTDSILKRSSQSSTHSTSK
ncbi:adhesion G-protein coupled receptor G2 [Drosophila subpulchrella]|uniref:adhesion G-protein coupled receptor G2 n=1 Tax=Drosophila subpulchrella TaxID=1486046 RepID=UPI0018A14635|nr:adhesion G-protein coupled receptor G2 [Drosophila subpulchrella]